MPEVAPVRVAFDRRHDIVFFGVEHFHPFDSHKYGRAWKMLRKEVGRIFVARGRPATDNALVADVRAWGESCCESWDVPPPPATV
jgi:hypothetical protein